MRYQAIEVDGQWFVWDLKHPDNPPVKFFAEREAKFASRAWNILSSWKVPQLPGENG